MTDLSKIEIDDLVAEINGRELAGYRMLEPNEQVLNEASDEEVRSEAVERGFEVFDAGASPFDHLDEARSLMLRGDLRECLYIIERDLPHEFSGLTDAVFKTTTHRPKPDLDALPKRVQAVISTCRQGQTLCLHKHLNREGATEKLWFFEPSGRAATPKAAEAATATAFLKPAMDGLLPNMSQTWRAAP